MEKITDIKENLQVKEIFKKGRTIIFVIDDDKEILLSEINEVSINYEKYCNNPKRDFSRKRKLPFELMLKTS